MLRLARAKAAAQTYPGELVLAADTDVVLDGELLGKPRDPEDACRMLGRIAGREHTVLTAVALEEPGRNRRTSGVATSRVLMAAMSREEIERYVATGEPLDKAGAYAVQGIGALFVEEVYGNYTNVVGLPLPHTYRLFREFGYDLLEFIDRQAVLERLRNQINLGLEQAKRGELLDGEEVFDELEQGDRSR